MTTQIEDEIRKTGEINFKKISKYISILSAVTLIPKSEHFLKKE